MRPDADVWKQKRFVEQFSDSRVEQRENEEHKPEPERFAQERGVMCVRVIHSAPQFLGSVMMEM